MSLSLTLTVAFLILLTANASPSDYFTAAVYEHARLGNWTTDAPADIVRWNLDYYKMATQVAKAKNADVIVFPEYGIFPPGDRKSLKNYLENTPDPKTVVTNPCDEYEMYAGRPILYTLSCMAKKNSIVVVANAGDIQPCTGQPGCPKDGVFHYNTNVVFDRKGALIARYYKERLFFELGMDLPRESQDPIVVTEFGTFATFICFDIIYERMSQAAKLPGVDAILFSSMWLYASPLYNSVQFFQSWAMGHNATLLASNTQLPGYSAIGSGIFQGLKGAAVYTFNPDGVSKLTVARVAKSHRRSAGTQWNASITAILPDGASEFVNDGKSVPAMCSYKILGNSTDIYKDFRCIEISSENYTLVKLTETVGHVEACSNGMCCSLNYSTNGLKETFYLGVHNGTHNAFNRYFWEEENCFLARCDDVAGKPCAVFPMRSKTLFYRVQLTANFSSEYIYPSVVSSGIRLVPLKEWDYMAHLKTTNKRTISFQKNSGRDLLVVGFKARCYNRDPPYER